MPEEGRWSKELGDLNMDSLEPNPEKPLKGRYSTELQKNSRRLRCSTVIAFTACYVEDFHFISIQFMEMHNYRLVEFLFITTNLIIMLNRIKIHSVERVERTFQNHSTLRLFLL